MKAIILSLVDKHSNESSMVSIEDLYQHLKREYGINRVLAGKLIVELFKEGKICLAQYSYIRRTQTCEQER